LARVWFVAIQKACVRDLLVCDDLCDTPRGSLIAGLAW
jgi:hypothetical protein